jgi:hypothetical protein
MVVWTASIPRITAATREMPDKRFDAIGLDPRPLEVASQVYRYSKQRFWRCQGRAISFCRYLVKI